MTDTPPDIFPETGCRLPVVDRESLDDAGKEAYDAIANPSGGALMGFRGPTAISMHSPGMLAYYGPLNRYLRFEAGFDAQLRELIILIAAREMDSEFEWEAHEPQALKDGIPQSTIDVIKHRKPTSDVPEDHALIIDYGREAMRDHKVTPETFAKLEKKYGAQGMVDLASLLGTYVATAILLTTVDAQLPPDAQTHLPIP